MQQVNLTGHTQITVKAKQEKRYKNILISFKYRIKKNICKKQQQKI